MNGNALYILGNFPGRSASIDVSQPVPAYFADRDRAFRLIVTDVGGVVVRGV